MCSVDPISLNTKWEPAPPCMFPQARGLEDVGHFVSSYSSLLASLLVGLAFFGRMVVVG